MRADKHETARLSPVGPLADLSKLRGRPVLLLCGSGLFAGETATMLYTWLRSLGYCRELDVVLESPGGQPSMARQCAVLLREFTDRLNILVLHRALSAAALFCLAADELLMTPLSVMGPIDPQMPGRLSGGLEQHGPEQQDQSAPRSVATEEIRLFREMAHMWFGVGESSEECFALLHAFTNRIFPTSLTAFYRADQEMRANADELLRFHQPDADIRRRIAEQLIENYFSHSHVIHRREAAEIGLLVRHATAEEETCLWQLWEWWKRYQSSPLEGRDLPFQVCSVLVADGFAACDGISLPESALEAVRSSPSANNSTERATSGRANTPQRGERRGWRQIPLEALECEYKED